MIRINKKILYPGLSYKITGICFKVHREYGRFCREKQYADLLEAIFKRDAVSYKREYEISVGNKVDFLIEDKIVLEIKAKKFITKDDYFQTQRYLQASRIELALIVNFRNTYLKPKRILNIKIYSDNSDEYLSYSDRTC